MLDFYVNGKKPLSNQKVVVITGGSSGLGKAISDNLGAFSQDNFIKIDLSLEVGVDLTKEEDIVDAVRAIKRTGLKVDYLINCAGVNFIDWFEDIPMDQWQRLISVNATAIWRLTSEMIKAEIFNSPASVCNIVSNASHMPMTNSAAYNASKGAAHILTLQMARELRKRYNLTVFGISPNKLSGTGMSDYIDNRVCELRGWTKEEAYNYQVNSLPAGKETDPNAVGEFIAFLLSSRQRHEHLAGCIIPYGA